MPPTPVPCSLPMEALHCVIFVVHGTIQVARRLKHVDSVSELFNPPPQPLGVQERLEYLRLTMFPRTSKMLRALINAYKMYQNEKRVAARSPGFFGNSPEVAILHYK